MKNKILENLAVASLVIPIYYSGVFLYGTPDFRKWDGIYQQKMVEFKKEESKRKEQQVVQKPIDEFREGAYKKFQTLARGDDCIDFNEYLDLVRGRR